ncbi:threonine aldolase family protein [Pendulispora albinea]|uniref:Aminotransferase class I/II-fold pyridoxal phosphate-dependent enzyme n=1 Tax=Pendulispora albinea TaxID=2741071 RepID=A0ABZ2LJU9_9BACT
MIDLRSDTVTRPTPGMRQAIAHAEVGDDVYGDDPTTRGLEEEVAQLLGKEAAIFTTSGIMANQLALGVQTRPGDEVIVGEGAHVFSNEGAAGAALSNVQFAVTGVGRDGFLTADEVEAAIKPVANWFPRTSLVWIENTINRAGGRVFPQADVRAIADRIAPHGLALHLDGARIWNASAATQVSVTELAAPFDTVSVCFSKGLGAPVGSALAGPAARIKEARRLRHRWGGGMRQSGIIAAGARYALAHHRARLVEDHANARRFAEQLLAQGLPGLSVNLAGVETNIVNIDLDTPAAPVSLAARELGLLINASAPRRLRAVTHLDVTSAQIDEAVTLLARAVHACRTHRSA